MSSTIVRELLLDTMRATVLTSATLTVDGSFRLHPRHGWESAHADEVRLRIRIRFREPGAAVSAARRCPTRGRPDFPLCRRAGGRRNPEANARARVRAVHELRRRCARCRRLPKWRWTIRSSCRARRHAPQLLRHFRDTPHAVLFATSSFWQGVDVVGEALSCVIIDKLPFASPGDPITAARIDAIRARGRRTVRRISGASGHSGAAAGPRSAHPASPDRGVLAVLDPRLRTKGYGRRFIASLPPAPLVHDLAAVEAFFRIV